MNRERLYRAEGIVLRRSDFGEADRILTLFTRGQGKLRVLAKGIKKTKSRKSGHLELFIHAQLLIARGRSMDIVTQAEAIQVFLPLRSDLRRTAYAYYVAELMDKFTEEGTESPGLFELLLDTLKQLAENPQLETIAHYFELHLLDSLGYRPELYRCVNCGRPVEEGSFSASGGGLVGPECASVLGEYRPGRRISAGALAALRLLLASSYAICASLNPTPEERRDMETALSDTLAYLLEGELKSLSLLAALRREALSTAAGSPESLQVK